jgi:hypothetical protein
VDRRSKIQRSKMSTPRQNSHFSSIQILMIYFQNYPNFEPPYYKFFPNFRIFFTVFEWFIRPVATLRAQVDIEELSDVALVPCITALANPRIRASLNSGSSVYIYSNSASSSPLNSLIRPFPRRTISK